MSLKSSTSRVLYCSIHGGYIYRPTLLLSHETKLNERTVDHIQCRHCTQDHHQLRSLLKKSSQVPMPHFDILTLLISVHNRWDTHLRPILPKHNGRQLRSVSSASELKIVGSFVQNNKSLFNKAQKITTHPSFGPSQSPFSFFA